MSIDKFYFIPKDENPSDIADPLNSHESALDLSLGEDKGKEAHTIYEMRAGVEHLYFFEDGSQAAETFERWRRQPCEKIVLTRVARASSSLSKRSRSRPDASRE